MRTAGCGFQALFSRGENRKCKKLFSLELSNVHLTQSTPVAASSFEVGLHPNARSRARVVQGVALKLP